MRTLLPKVHMWFERERRCATQCHRHSPCKHVLAGGIRHYFCVREVTHGVPWNTAVAVLGLGSTDLKNSIFKVISDMNTLHWKRRPSLATASSTVTTPCPGDARYRQRSELDELWKVPVCMDFNFFSNKINFKFPNNFCKSPCSCIIPFSIYPPNHSTLGNFAQ